MSDGWTNDKSRSVMSFLVDSPSETGFLKSVDTFGISNFGADLFELLDYVVQEVGVEHVITDFVSACVSANNLLELKYLHIFWSPGAILHL